MTTGNAPMSALLFSLLLSIVLVADFPGSGLAITKDATLLYLKNLSIQQLASIEVTSVSKTEEKLSDADAAVYVITSEDIRRSGMTSIPEILRMVPGLQVSRIDGNNWAISARGFNAWFADKLLVLVDGRSVYTPLFSGVFWNIQDTLLDDIDRIEVIRGPGATLWGANAVNGVINIITKKAKKTKGGLLKGGGGNIEQGFGAVRYGGKIGTRGYYRAYAKYFNRGAFETKEGRSADDQWHMGRAGFRLDFDLSKESSLTLEGGICDGQTHDRLSPNYLLQVEQPHFQKLTTDYTGGDLLGRWTHRSGSGSSTTFKWYVDRTDWNSNYIKETRDTLDLDFQHSFKVFSRNSIVWGLEYRMYHDNIPRTSYFDFDPKSRINNMFSGFFQDQITIIPEKLDFTIGTKLEHNDFSGFEIQPSGRFRFKPTANQTLWAAISRAVRTPSRADHDMNVLVGSFRTGPVTNVLLYKGNDHFDSEEVVAYEAGYRVVPKKRFSLDISAFYNVYWGLRGLAPSSKASKANFTLPGRTRVIALVLKNQFHENSYGVEVAGTVQLARWWKTSLNYSWLKLRLHTSQQMVGQELDEGNVPENQFSIRSYMDLPWNLQFDTLFFYVDSLRDMNIPSYTRLDIRLGWNPAKDVSVDLKLQNLLDDRHPEYINVGPLVSSQVPRSVYGKVTWKF